MKQNIYIRITLHLLFWIVYLISCLLIYGYLGSNWRYILRATLLLLPAIAFPTYIILYFVIPKLLLNKKYILSIVIYIFLPFGFILLQRYSLILFNLIPDSEKWRLIDLVNFQFLLVSFESYLMISIAIGIKLFKLWIQNQQIRNQLEVQNLKSELGLMKAQVNPHFLFNTLNNIHSYIHYDKEKSADAVIKLSDIMRYMLYETSGDKVPLIKEINYIKSYIDLQLLRFENEDAVSLQIKGNPNNKIIAPMLFIAFLENAFKHGNKNAENPAVRIKIDIEENQLFYEVRNYLNPLKNTSETYHGFGIKNLEKRLLLLYPEKYMLSTEITNNEFIAQIHLYELN